MHRFNSGDDGSRTPEGLKTQHWSSDPLDCPVVLLDDVIQALVLTHQDVNTGVSLDAFNGGCVGAARVGGNLLWHIV